MAPPTMVLAPLFLIITPLLFVHATAQIYRSIYSEDEVRKALEAVARYRSAKAEYERTGSKRALKKLRGLEYEYREARRLLLRGFLVKTTLFMGTYLLGSLLFITYMPAVPSPYYLPGITLMAGGECVAPSFIIYFIAYIVFYFVYRDRFL